MNFQTLIRVLSIGFFTLLFGCQVPTKPYQKPTPIVLQDPLPGQAIVYLLRAPYDSVSINVVIRGQRLASLDSARYTAISLNPGMHALHTKQAGFFAENDIAPPLELTLEADKRYFYYLSGATSSRPTWIGNLPTGIPLIIPQTGTIEGSRSWKQCSELDAQGLMSISKLILPLQ